MHAAGVFSTLAVVLTAVSAQTFDPATALKALCPNENTPGCAIATTCLTSNKCDNIAVGQTICADPASASSAGCTALKAYCGTTTCPPALTNVPTARNASTAVASICREMPDMKDCQGSLACPAPGADGVSNCKSMAALAALCIDMPKMSQCAEWTQFCQSNTNFTSFCTAGGASNDSPHTGHGGGTSNTTGGAGTPGKSSGTGTASASVLMAAVGLIIAAVGI